MWRVVSSLCVVSPGLVMGGSEGDDKGEDAEAPQGEGGAGKAAIPPPPMPPPAMLPPAPRAQASAGTQQKDEDAKTESKEVGEGEQNWATTALPAEGAGGGEPGAYEKPPWSGAPPTESFPYYFEVSAPSHSFLLFLSPRSHLIPPPFSSSERHASAGVEC